MYLFIFLRFLGKSEQIVKKQKGVNSILLSITYDVHIVILTTFIILYIFPTYNIILAGEKISI